jgi:hypothetical protein
VGAGPIPAPTFSVNIPAKVLVLRASSTLPISFRGGFGVAVRTPRLFLYPVVGVERVWPRQGRSTYYVSQDTRISYGVGHIWQLADIDDPGQHTDAFLELGFMDAYQTWNAVVRRPRFRTYMITFGLTLYKD